MALIGSSKVLVIPSVEQGWPLQPFCSDVWVLEVAPATVTQWNWARFSPVVPVATASNGAMVWAGAFVLGVLGSRVLVVSAVTADLSEIAAAPFVL